MSIFKDVAELLHSNDCVIVPNFGAFVLKTKSAYIQKNEFFDTKLLRLKLYISSEIFL